MTRFICRMLTAGMALATLLVVDAMIAGSLPLLACLVLLPAAALSTGRLFQLSVRPAHRARRPHHTPPPVQGVRACRPAPRPSAGCVPAGGRQKAA